MRPAVSSAPVAAIAADLGVTAAQVSLAWLLGHSPVIRPIPGTASIPHLEQNVAAAGIELTDEHRRQLDALG